MSIEKIKQFNEILNSFLIQVSPLVGTSYHYHFQQVIKVNSILPLEQFLVYALPMRDKILNRDETYFADNDNDIYKIANNKVTPFEMFRLQGIYKQLDINSKTKIWELIQSLLLIGEEYITYKYLNGMISHPSP